MSTADTYGFWLGSFFHGEKLPAFALLAGMVVTFLCLRVNTRLIRNGVSWWPRNIRRGDVHVHHVVIGLPLMFVVGVVEFAVRPGSPWVELLAMVFGGAAGAVFDEFALVLHLKDVYWEREGRKSLVAVFLATSFTLFMTVGMIPLGYSGPPSQSVILEWVAMGSMILNLVFVAVAFFKGKLWMGFIGLFIPVIAFLAAVRLARPQSVWARWRYASGSQKMARAERRARDLHRRWGTRQERLITCLFGATGETAGTALGLADDPAVVPAGAALLAEGDESPA